MDGTDPAYIKVMNQYGNDPYYVNTPPLHTGYVTGPPPIDRAFGALAAQTRTGKIKCQRAIVAMYLVRPYSDYRPTIYDEFEQQFIALNEANEPMELCLYEQNGQLVMSDDYDIYALYKLHQSLCASCIIIGPYTKVWGLEAFDKPYHLQ